MSVIGFDIGNESCVIAVARRGRIDVLLNDESKRETPSVVCFGEKQRFLGSAGAASATAYPKSTISQVKRLIGRVYKDPSVQKDLKLLPFATSEGPRGGILIELEYLKKKMKFTPVEILGMLFTHLKQRAEKNLESPVVDCVIGIPSYFTDLQRREYLDAASIAGLNPLRFMHDCTATALGYGMYKADYLEGGPTYVIFLDIGHCDTQVTVAGFIQGQMEILSHSFDQNLGGRDFDDVLFKYFAAQFNEKHDIDVYSHARASIMLRASCEKVKKILSANAEALLSIDCLIGNQDMRGVITREEFEKLSSELLKRVTVLCHKAVGDSGLTIENISTIELVGSGSRIPAITKILTSFFHREPTRTLNASECVARGCALRCAMLSPTVKVQDYKVIDLFPYSIALPLDRPEDKSCREFLIFPKGTPFPCHKMLKHSGKKSFYFQLLYSNKTNVPSGISPIVGHFIIESSETPASEQANVEFELKLNCNGIVEIKSASLVDDRRHTHLDCFSYPERVVVDNLVFSENLDVATTKDELCEAQERELILAEQDKKVEQTKVELKSFVKDTRSKLSSAYRSFATDSEKEEISNRLQETEDWLYEDNDDECQEDYTGKLEDLKKLLDPIEMRYNSDKEEKDRAEITRAMQTCIEKYCSEGNLMSPSHKKAELSSAYRSFATDSEKEVITNKLQETEDWIYEDSDDECEDDYTGKLEYFKKLLDPIEMKYNSYKEEKARTEVTKALQTCVEKYRLVAKSMPPSRDKRELLVQSNIAQEWLNHQQPILRIKEVIEEFERNCKGIIGSIPSFPNDDKPVRQDQRDRPIVSNKRDQRVDSDQRELPLILGQRDQPVHSRQSDQPESDQHVDQRETSCGLKPNE